MDARERQRAANLWLPFARKFPIVGKAAQLEPEPDQDFDGIGGLEEPKYEILTYACAATDPDVYKRWGTRAPTALLMMGAPECGKSMLAEALAVRTGTPFLKLRVPRLILQVLHAGGQVGGLLDAWGETLGELPRLTIFFREVDFTRVESLIGRRPDLPISPAMDFVLEFIDRAITVSSGLVIGSTSHPSTLSPIFLEPGRFERVVWVQPSIPDDVVAALEIHAAEAEARAGRPLFEAVHWAEVVKRNEKNSVGGWVRVVHAVLRRKARCDAADEAPGGVTTQDLIREAERHERTSRALPSSPGKYL
jgi:SpoVK/Ycf46/Vps4 family AAA+-type ATPase